MMRKHATHLVFFLLTGILVSIAACTGESCLEETESFLEASFYSYRPPQNAAPPDSLTVFGLGRDTSKIYSSSTSIKVARLPLNHSAGSTVFVMKINGITDTLEIRHYSYPHLISRECGYTNYFNIYSDSLVFTKNAIDSIWTRNNIITTADEENIQIFY